MSRKLNLEFMRDGLKFFNKYAVLPPHGLQAGHRNTQVLWHTGPVTSTGQNVVSSETVRPADRVQWVNFKEWRGNEFGAITFERANAAPGAGEDWRQTGSAVPMHFLPWNSMSIVETTIPPISTDPHNDSILPAIYRDNPPYFFTAAINGCSVFAHGDPKSPRVHHAGIDGTLTLDTVKFWEATFEMVAGRLPLNRWKQINTTHYSTDPACANARSKTQLGNEFFDHLEKAHKKHLRIKMVNPWGCVFGLRIGQYWSFYLQENATVVSYEFVKKGAVNEPFPNRPWTTLKVADPVTGATNVEVQKKLLRTMYAVKHTTTHPLRVSEFYPGGKGHYNCKLDLKKITIK